jgi:hypothetical protein
MWTDPGNIQIAHRHMKVEIETEPTQFPVKEYGNGIFVAVYVYKTYLIVFQVGLLLPDGQGEPGLSPAVHTAPPPVQRGREPGH